MREKEREIEGAVSSVLSSRLTVVFEYVCVDTGRDTFVVVGAYE